MILSPQNRKTLLAVALVTFLLSAMRATASGVLAAERKAVVVVLPFHCDDQNWGEKITLVFRKKVERIPSVVVIDQFSAADMVDAAGIDLTFAAPEASVKALMKMGQAVVAIWGDAKKGDGVYPIDVRALDLRCGKEKLVTRHLVPSGYREISPKCQEVVNEIFGLKPKDPDHATHGPPVPVDSKENLVANGNFEKGKNGQPANWERIDGLSTFWIAAEDPAHGKCIKIDTDIYESEWKDWRKKIAQGADPSKAPQKTPTSGNKYDTVAGTYGVHFYSDKIPVKEGATYRIDIDFRGSMSGMFFPKIFVKGYKRVVEKRFGAQDREIYRMYLACRPKKGGAKWEHFSRRFHPIKGVEFMRVMLYAYWRPGTYFFDNVIISEVKKKKDSEFKGAGEK